ncbi:vezatin-like isoform X1 [Octopus vulgaris]|uniref:Vezatin n=2 Tax=Octopus vulgaris TaxID=6645 RepID=A0AA36F0Y0_OCTVU|nr:vezatin-like isoform X1 [Octopus vulgaris]
MATDDCDEDVIFENSALYKHLVDAGVTDIPVEKSTKSSEPKEDVEDESVAAFPPEKSDNVQTNMELLKQVFRKLREFSSFDLFIIQMYCHFNCQILHQVARNKSLEDDDKIFLENFIVETENVGKAWKIQTFILCCLYPIFIFLSLYLLCLYSPVAAILIMNPNICLFRVLVKFYILFLIVLSLWILWHILNLKHTASCIKALVQQIEESYLLFKKSLRLIQEVELVQRGFTLVSNQMTMKSGQSAYKYNRLCPELRKLVFITARSNMLFCRKSTNILLRIHPLVEEVDKASTYLAHIPLEDYGPSLQLSEDNNDNLSKLTDDFSVTALKAMMYLYNMQQSELLRRLALCFCINALPEDQKGTLNSSTNDLASCVKCSLESNYIKLKNSYEFHRSGFQEPDSKPFNAHDKKPCSPLSDLYMAVHSLDLHLQAALCRSSNLSSEFEKYFEINAENDISNNEQNECEISAKENQWYSHLQSIKAELEACRACYEIGLDKFEKMFKKQQEPTPKLNPKINTKEKDEKIICAEDINPVIVDEVFEGFTDENADDFDCKYVHLSVEEMEKQRKDMEESKRMMHELKSVIAVRAFDREKREDIAIKRQKQGLECQPPSGYSSEGDQSEDSLHSDSLQSDSLQSHVISAAEKDSMQESENLSDDLLGEDNLDLDDINMSESHGSTTTSDTGFSQVSWSKQISENSTDQDSEPFFLHQNQSSEIDCDMQLRNLIFSPLTRRTDCETDSLNNFSFPEDVSQNALHSDSPTSKIDSLDPNSQTPVMNQSTNIRDSDKFNSYQLNLQSDSHPYPSGSDNLNLDAVKIGEVENITSSEIPASDSNNSFFLHQEKEADPNLQGTNLAGLQDRLLARDESTFMFARNIAAQASARCKENLFLNIQTFGDSDSIEDDDSVDSDKEINDSLADDSKVENSQDSF